MQQCLEIEGSVDADKNFVAKLFHHAEDETRAHGATRPPAQWYARFDPCVNALGVICNSLFVWSANRNGGGATIWRVMEQRSFFQHHIQKGRDFGSPNVGKGAMIDLIGLYDDLSGQG